MTFLLFYLAALIPWVVALLYRRGQGAFFVEKGDPRHDLTHPYAFSVLFPGIWAVMSPTGSRRWDILIVVGLGIGILLVSVAIKNRRARRLEGLLFLLALNSFYGFGVATALNQDLDAGAPQIYNAQILSKKIVDSRRRIYVLTLGPWGPRATPKDVWVTEQVYRQVSVRETICVELHPGALRASWFQTRACSAGTR